MSSHEEYLNYLSKNPEEINYFLNKFTINYTHFFRNSEIFDRFEEVIKQYTKNRKNILRIWSAPCATGEEPYSIAMLMEKIRKETKSFPDFIVVASDIDKTALEIAKTGVYGDYSIHEMPNYYYVNYFTKKNTPLGPKYSISEEIKKKVAFIKEDIISGHKKTIKYDIIFCRNFFIYINKPSQEKLLRMLERQLIEGGILILGKTEMIMNTNSRFQSLDSANHFYVKGKMKQTALFDKQPIIKKETTCLDNKAKVVKVEKISKPVKKRLPIPAVKKLSKEPIKKPIKALEKKDIKPKLKKTVEKLEKKPLKPVKIKVIEPIEEEIIKIPIDDMLDIKEILEIDTEKPDERIERYLTHIEMKGLKLEKLIKKVKKQESKLKQHKIHLDQKDKFLRYREREVEQAEVQLNQRIIILGLREKKLEEKEVELNEREKLVEIREREIINQAQKLKKLSESSNIKPKPDDKPDEEDLGLIVEPNIRGELNLPSGYYSVLNAFNKKNKSSKLSIYGLGSGIGLILRDKINKVYAMSHISLPKPLKTYDSNQLKFPHNYINKSVKDLLDKSLYNGANRKNINAIVVGGAKDIEKKGSIYQENIDAIKHELSLHKIPIVKNLLGGISERSLIYDINDNLLYIKNKWEDQFRKINL